MDAAMMGPACDVYSLGVILYELLAGRLPFIGDPMAVLSQVLLDEPPPPSRFRAGIDPELEASCRTAMAKKREDRYGSMAELAQALQDYLRQAAASGAGPTPIPLAEPRPPRPAGLTAADLGGRRSMTQALVPAAVPPPARKGGQGGAARATRHAANSCRGSRSLGR